MKDSVTIELFQSSPTLYKVIVRVPAVIVDKFIDHAIERLSKKSISGFSKIGTPQEYVRQNFMQNIITHIKKFFFKYFVIARLYREIRNKKIALLGEPRLLETYLEPHKDAEYHLEFNSINRPITKEWKYISFKASQRKKYKDIDKQTTEFFKEEEIKENNYAYKNIIQEGDWVNFELCLVDDENKNIIADSKENFWIKIGSDDTTLPFQEVFLGKKIGEKFTTNHQCVQELFNNDDNITYTFLITILDIIHNAFFSIENFKKHFKIKTNKKALQKLVEVFSFTNDLSLRRNITNEAFETLLNTYTIEIPQACILRQQQLILENLQENPDYIVYRNEPGFKDRIKKLAIQQIKEIALMELLAHSEDLTVTDDDVKNYLNLTQRARTRDFLHFLHPQIKEATECPLHTENLKQSCFREKALNHAIFYLTKV